MSCISRIFARYKLINNPKYKCENIQCISWIISEYTLADIKPTRASWLAEREFLQVHISQRRDLLLTTITPFTHSLWSLSLRQTVQRIIDDITGLNRLDLITLLLPRLISAEICDINEVGRRHIIYMILVGGPTIYNMHYYWVSPSVAYCIYNITGLASHI